MRPRALVSFASALLAAAALTACARSAEERQLDEMRSTIDGVQEDRDRADRLAFGADEGDGRVTAANAPPPRPIATAVPAPVPESVRFGDGEETPPVADLDTEDTSPRPSIRVVGAPRPGGRNGMREAQSEQVFVADEGDGAGASTSSGSSALDPEAKRAYDAALSLVTARQYEKALDALAAFLVRWPDHPYADNALYWRGECYFARGDYERASQQFDGVVARFPAGNKAPDALLKLGICHLKLGDPNKAKECFVRLAQQYPGTEASRRIPPVAQPAAPPTPPRGPAPEVTR